MLQVQNLGSWLIGLLVLSITYSAIVTSQNTSESMPALDKTSIGSSDYVTFWASWRIMLADDNPYDPASYQRQLDLQRDQMHVMFPPPWATLLTAPLGAFSLTLSAKLWMFLSVVLLISSTWILLSQFAHISPRILGLACCFAPAGLCLSLGQITIALTFVFCLLLLALHQRCYFWAGIYSGILTIKPHLFFIFFAILGFSMLRTCRWRFFAGLTTSLLLMVATILIIYPSAIKNWIQFVSGKAPMDWVGSTLPAWFRLCWNEITGQLPEWPNIAIPLAALVVTILYLWSKLKDLTWIFVAPWLTGLSILFSPYGHPYDQVILLPIYVMLIAYCFHCFKDLHAKGLMALLLVMQLIWFAQLAWVSKELYLLAWFTPMLLFVWRYTIHHSGLAKYLRM